MQCRVTHWNRCLKVQYPFSLGIKHPVLGHNDRCPHKVVTDSCFESLPITSSESLVQSGYSQKRVNPSTTDEGPISPEEFLGGTVCQPFLFKWRVALRYSNCVLRKCHFHQEAQGGRATTVPCVWGAVQSASGILKGFNISVGVIFAGACQAWILKHEGNCTHLVTELLARCSPHSWGTSEWMGMVVYSIGVERGKEEWF